MTDTVISSAGSNSTPTAGYQAFAALDNTERHDSVQTTTVSCTVIVVYIMDQISYNGSKLKESNCYRRSYINRQRDEHIEKVSKYRI